MNDPSEISARRIAQLRKLRGTWRSHGYGTLLEIDADGYRLHEETAVSCRCIFEGTLAELAEHLVDVRVSPRARGFSARRSTGVTRVHYRRLSRTPARCAQAHPHLSKDPVLTFEVFWHTFLERYAMFDLRGVDWHELYATHRPRVGPDTTPEALHGVLIDMLRPLRDGHVSLHSPLGHFNAGGPIPLQERIADELGVAMQDPRVGERLMALRQQVRTIVEEHYVQGRPHRAGHGTMVWGRLDDRTGYLDLRAMAGMSGGAHRPRQDQHAAAGILDRVIRDLGELPAMVIDVRGNPGGYDGVSLRIAGRFIDRKRLAFTKVARARDRYTGRQSVHVEPRGKWRYGGQIYLLTSRLTFSAGEIFVLSMMQHPRVTRVGERTHGELSDVMERHLPNGWVVLLSNELYHAADGQLYEDVGIPPQVAIPYLLPEDVEGGRDPMLDHVLGR
ncbi:MAG: S41 family peptidase [Myxococcales bacterium]|jgi:hypothetical protein